MTYKCNRWNCWSRYPRCCIGLQLIKGTVTIFDKYDPGKMTSYGNAGHFSPYAVLQLNRPMFYMMFQRCFSVLMTLQLKWNYILK